MRGVTRGVGMKASDHYAIPLCRHVHEEITNSGNPDAILLDRWGIDGRELADALWSASPDFGSMQRVVLKAFQRAQIRNRNDMN